MLALPPQLRAVMPPAIRVEVLSDRTVSIRASVADVEATLLLTVGLVVTWSSSLFPAPGVGDGNSQRHPAAILDRHVRRDVFR